MTRWLFFLLLLVNLLLWLWSFRLREPETQRPPPLPSGVPAIQLAEEPDALPKPPASSKEDTSGPSGTADQPTKEPPWSPHVEPDANHETVPHASLPDEENPSLNDVRSTQQPKDCVRLGPFVRQADAAQLLWELSDQGLYAEIEVEVIQKPSGFWVMIPVRNEAATSLIAKLKAAGIGDVWQFSKDEPAAALSLGLYSDQTQAEARKGALAEKGFETQVKPRTVEESFYWVQLAHRPENPNIKAIFERIFEAHPSLMFPPPNCGEIVSQ